MAHPLTHEELILVTRLVTNHIVGAMPPEIEKLANKLLDYAQRTTGNYETKPLILEPAVGTQADRMAFRINTLDAGV